MSTEAALLRTIRANPDDDTARLVYADFIEEAGDSERGELIRVQVALANTPESDAGRGELEDREHTLLAAHEARWLGVMPDSDGLIEWEFARGFVAEVAATPSFMLNEGSDLCAAHPIQRWRVQCSQQDMAEDLLEAGRRGWFSRLESLDLAGWFQSIGEMERFLTRSEFGQLRHLDLTDRDNLADLPEILERCSFREQLKVLRCSGRYPGEIGVLDAWDLTRALGPARLQELAVPACELTAQDVRGLLVGDCCSELRSLDIRDNPIEPDGWDAFRGVKCRLRQLDLSGTPLGSTSLESVLRQESLADLRVLELNRVGSAMANIRALASSPFWSQAEELRLQNGTIPEHSLDPLFATVGPAALRILDVSENYFRDSGVRRLCEAPWATSISWLGLSSNYLTDESLRLIAACERFSRLRTLHLAFNNPHDQEGAGFNDRITDAGLIALAGSRHLTGLRILSVSNTDVTEAGIEAIVNSPYMRLTSLGLRACRLSQQLVPVLAKAPAVARLEWLDLSYNTSLAANTLMPLAESEFLSPRCELDIRGCGVDDETRAALRERLGRRLST